MNYIRMRRRKLVAELLLTIILIEYLLNNKKAIEMFHSNEPVTPPNSQSEIQAKKVNIFLPFYCNIFC